MALDQWINRARDGDLNAFGQLVLATQGMVFAVARQIVGNDADAHDAAQETYLRAFGRIGQLQDSAAFTGWLRRIAINAAQSIRRQRRLSLSDEALLPEIPVLDEEELAWSDEQRIALSAAIVALNDEDRLLCERFYLGGWSSARLAAELNCTDAALRKRLQRIRQRMLEEIQMSEQTNMSGEVPPNFPAKIVELLARPRLQVRPENPVGAVWQKMMAMLSEFQQIDVPEIVEDAQLIEAFGSTTSNSGAPNLEAMIHRIDDRRFLRCEMDVPMLLALRGKSGPLNVAAAGKAYRVVKPDRARMESFHQGDLIVVREGMGEWDFMPRLQQILAELLRGKPIRMEQFDFPLSRRAWEISVDWDGQWTVITSWGLFTDPVIRLLGNDPARFGALGVSFGLERLACLHYGIDDIRKVEAVTLSRA